MHNLYVYTLVVVRIFTYINPCVTLLRHRPSTLNLPVNEPHPGTSFLHNWLFPTYTPVTILPEQICACFPPPHPESINSPECPFHL